MLKLLKTTFNYAELAVGINDEVSRYVKMGRGLLQGLLLSPSLINVFVDDMPRVLRSKSKGINIGVNKINSLIYADDISLIANSQQPLRKCLDACERYSSRNGVLSRPKSAKL